MGDFNITTSQTVDQFILNNPTYSNISTTYDRIFVSEGAILAQGPGDIEDVLYVADLILGENSSGTAVIKSGDVEITKPNFELYINPVTVFIQDVLCPVRPRLITATGVQELDSVLGQTSINSRWEIPTVNERYMYMAGVASGTYQTMELAHNQIETDTEVVYEIIDVDPFGGSSFLTRNLTGDQNILQVVDSTNFYTGQIIRISGTTGVAYYRLLSDGSVDILLDTRGNRDVPFTIGDSVQTMTVNEKTEGIDYTIDYNAGKVFLVSGQFTSGKEVVVSYAPILTDLDHFELYRVPGDNPVVPSEGHSLITVDAVKSTSGFQRVNDDISTATVTLTDKLPTSYNSQTWTYYLFAVDDETNPNSSFASIFMVETIPTVPQNPQIASGDGQLYLSWEEAPSSEDNTDGYNVYRSVGEVFDPSTAYRVNSVVIARNTPFFDDSEANLGNRRHPSEVPYPENGKIYSYKIESEDTDSEWDVGTKNQDAETGPASYIALKNL